MTHLERRDSDQPTHGELAGELHELREQIRIHREEDHGKIDEVLDLVADALWGPKRPPVEGGGRHSELGLMALRDRGVKVKLPGWINASVIALILVLIIQLIALFAGVEPITIL